MFSIAILTYNEEIPLGACLDSVDWADDVLVFDSFSSDRTVEIARAKGARVIQHHFEGYASQRNACLEGGQFKHDWVFMLDADERFTPELKAEIERTLAAGPSQSLFRLRRKDYFMGTWIRRAGGYPTWFGRLLRRGQVHISRDINELYETSGKAGYLQQHLLHYPFSKGIEQWLDRHNLYSTMEAELLEREGAGVLSLKQLLDRDPSIRRKALKAIYYRLPGRPLLVFAYLYLVRLGLLEGRAGFNYSLLRAYYELMINLKRRWLRDM